jgi:hypothetical protein
MGMFSVTIMAAMLAAAGPGAPEAAPSQWALRSIVPGGPLCRAEKFGGPVDTHIARNNLGKLVLVVGRPDWDHGESSLPVTISVDGGPAVSLDGTALGPVVIVLIEGDALTAQLKTAHDVTWNLPWGRFTAEVDGLGKALDSIVICRG